MESNQEISGPAVVILSQAEDFRLALGVDLTNLNRRIGVAKAERICWIEELAFSVIHGMTSRLGERKVPMCDGESDAG